MNVFRILAVMYRRIREPQASAFPSVWLRGKLTSHRLGWYIALGRLPPQTSYQYVCLRPAHHELSIDSQAVSRDANANAFIIPIALVRPALSSPIHPGEKPAAD